MSQQVQELIDKIKTEGIQKADKQASHIKAEAQKKADHIIAEANKKSEQIISDASSRVKKMEEATTMALKQASRDTLLSLRREIENILKRIVTSEIDKTLSAEQLSNVITEVAKNALGTEQTSQDILVAVNKDDYEQLKNGFLTRLKKEIKEPIKLESSNDIGRGFSISFDGGKSSFDFSDESLAEYLSTFLNAQVSELVKDAAPAIANI